MKTDNFKTKNIIAKNDGAIFSLLSFKFFFLLQHLLTSAILRDTRFLASQLIMDYSLLAGVDEDNKIVVGIIGRLQTIGIIVA